MLFIVELSKLSKAWIIFLVAMRLWETPVPIPNTMVKTQAADGTALETVWESRWPPKLKKKKDRFRNETSDIQVRKDLAKKSEVPTD